MRVLGGLAIALICLALVGFMSSFAVEASLRSQAKLVQIASNDEAGSLQKLTPPFLAILPHEAALPGLGDQNSTLVDTANQSRVLKLDSLLGILIIGRASAVGLFITACLVLVLARRAQRGGILTPSLPPEE